MIRKWKNAGGSGENSLIKFFKSDFMNEIPYLRIASYLLAHLLTHTKPLGTGDIYDDSHLSAMIPLCDIVITDKKMSNLMNVNWKFDKKYNTKIFSLSDYDQIISTLENL